MRYTFPYAGLLGILALACSADPRSGEPESTRTVEQALAPGVGTTFQQEIRYSAASGKLKSHCELSLLVPSATSLEVTATEIVDGTDTSIDSLTWSGAPLAPDYGIGKPRDRIEVIGCSSGPPCRVTFRLTMVGLPAGTPLGCHLEAEDASGVVASGQVPANALTPHGSPPSDLRFRQKLLWSEDGSLMSSQCTFRQLSVSTQARVTDFGLSQNGAPLFGALPPITIGSNAWLTSTGAVPAGRTLVGWTGADTRFKHIIPVGTLLAPEDVVRCEGRFEDAPDSPVFDVNLTDPGYGAGMSLTAGASGQGPMFEGCAIFPADNAWNQDISRAPVHPNNDVYLAHMSPGANVHLDLGVTEEYYGIPYAVVGAQQPLVPIAYGTDGADYSDESDPGPFPIPLDVHIEGGSPSDPDPSSGDRHVIVLQRGVCDLFELYNTVRTTSPAGFMCSSSAQWDVDINDTRPPGWTSADAAGLPIFPGLLRYEEVAAGAIQHALRFTVPSAQRAYIPPASHMGPVQDPAYPPYGLRVRLKASFDDSAYSAQAQVITRALKKYGLMFADQGSGWYISGTPNPGWASLVSELHGTRPIPASAFEVVYTGDPVVGYGSN